MNEPIRRSVGLTHDGFELEEHYRLRISGPCFCGWCGITHWGSVASMEREFNVDWDGSRKTYWSMLLLGFHIQFGWLWEEAEQPA